MPEFIQKIGVIGGMFDPIHLGHLISANQAVEQFGLEYVLFVPTAVAPHKRQAHAEPKDRLEMTKMAVADNPSFKVSEMEMKGSSPSYSYETIKELREYYDNIYFIVGLDAFEEIYTWKSADRLLFSCNIVVAARPGSDFVPVLSKLEANFREKQIEFEFAESKDKYCQLVITPVGSPYRIYVCRFTEINVSSTIVRQMAASGESIKYLTPPVVEEYILDKGHYSTCRSIEK